jgi:hypothetical protein
MLFPFCGAPAARPRRPGNDFSALPTQVAVDGSGREAGDHRSGPEDRSTGSECVDALCHCNENAAERDNRTRPIAPTNPRSEPAATDASAMADARQSRVPAARHVEAIARPVTLLENEVERGSLAGRGRSRIAPVVERSVSKQQNVSPAISLRAGARRGSIGNRACP